MQPPSFEDFIRKEFSVRSVAEKSAIDELSLTTCPTPGCGSHAIMLRYDDGLFAGFTCANGCVFSAHRNAFNGEFSYYQLDDMPVATCNETIRGMKLPAFREPHTDWY